MERDVEKKIILKILSGHGELYKELIDAYSSQLFTFVNGMIHNYHDSKDIVQEVFVKGYFSLDKFRLESSFYSWIYRIAYNETISHIRRSKQRATVGFFDEIEYQQQIAEEIFEEGLATKVQQDEMIDRLSQALASLDTNDRLLIHNFYTAGRSINELHEMTGLSHSNIKVKLHRIKKRLAMML